MPSKKTEGFGTHENWTPLPSIDLLCLMFHLTPVVPDGAISNVLRDMLRPHQTLRPLQPLPSASSAAASLKEMRSDPGRAMNENTYWTQIPGFLGSPRKS